MGNIRIDNVWRCNSVRNHSPGGAPPITSPSRRHHHLTTMTSKLTFKDNIETHHQPFSLLCLQTPPSSSWVKI
uniref:Uncharacterized protein n=2 Tax=Helianthus annuus TaxID=4232 RepID=A0A251SDK9_HELAN